jgi:hypothetical protein
VARPDPERGQVIRFEYLWASEESQGYADGEKYRPCAIVVTIAPKGDKPLRAMLCGITHTRPRPPSEGVAIPAQAKAALGLDAEPSWAIISEVNTVNWSDARFRKTPSGGWTYGELPAQVMEEIRDKMIARIKAGTVDILDRDRIDERGGC